MTTRRHIPPHMRRKRIPAARLPSFEALLAFTVEDWERVVAQITVRPQVRDDWARLATELGRAAANDDANAVKLRAAQKTIAMMLQPRFRHADERHKLDGAIAAASVPTSTGEAA